MNTLGLKFEDLTVGQFAENTVTVSEADVVSFAEISGDRNPVHLDPLYAASSPFKERVAHGVLVGGYISALIGMELPGPGAVLVSLAFQFKRPVKLGANVNVRVEIKTLEPRRGLATPECVCLVNKKCVLEGEAVIMVPRRPATTEELLEAIKRTSSD